MTTISDWKQKIKEKLSEVEDLIQDLPKKGLKSIDCQRTYLEQKLNELEFAINGTKQEDLNN